jgi:tRNA-splicing ligase RtcB (3'-phosphate/5'-hydroxy nucleic acid ligase)
MERISRRLVSWASAAYKDIDVVMKDADDLVQVCHVLRQIVNVKGD